jgi:hypothetical protein
MWKTPCPLISKLPQGKQKTMLHLQRKYSLLRLSDPAFKASYFTIVIRTLKVFQRALSAILTTVTKINVIISLLQIRTGLVSV